MTNLPFSQACENNKTYILEKLKPVLRDRREVLEMGSGTGQHACHFASAMPHLRWQPTDVAENIPWLQPRCNEYAGDNLLAPKIFDVRQQPWDLTVPDGVFTANSLHIMSADSVKLFFGGLANAAVSDLKLAVYGPFNYDGGYTSESNARFDRWLFEQNPESAIRDFEFVNELATQAGLTLLDDYEMPANNRLLVWSAS